MSSVLEGFVPMEKSIPRGIYCTAVKEFYDMDQPCIGKTYSTNKDAANASANLRNAARKLDLPVKVSKAGQLVLLVREDID